MEEEEVLAKATLPGGSGSGDRRFELPLPGNLPVAAASFGQTRPLLELQVKQKRPCPVAADCLVPSQLARLMIAAGSCCSNRADSSA